MRTPLAGAMPPLAGHRRRLPGVLRELSRLRIGRRLFARPAMSARRIPRLGVILDILRGYLSRRCKGGAKPSSLTVDEEGGLDMSSDIELARALREGDEAALAAIYDRYMPGIYDFLARFLRDRSAAEDLAQMTFIRAWEKRDSLRDPARVKSWLYTIAHNLATNHVTRNRPRQPIYEELDLTSAAPGPEDQTAAKAVAELVWAAAASLEPRQYAVLDLTVRRELATGEIAQVLGIPAGHAAVLVSRAKEALGNPVRSLLVAQRRDHCQRLAELVPAGVTSLTPEQRGSVDRHMRRCPECQG